jgi:O-antigen/teichoic acid export membrane protein
MTQLTQPGPADLGPGEPAPPQDAPAGPQGGKARAQGEQSLASGVRILSLGIASTGVFTFLYLALASHLLGRQQYSRISICWSVMFVLMSVIHRPIEQLMSRHIAVEDATGGGGNVIRTPALLQGACALGFLILALIFRHALADGLLDHSQSLYWVLVIGTVAYAASYFARGWLAGHMRFGLYGGLVLLESSSRFLFALAVAVGITVGGRQELIGIGMLAAPFVSLIVIPFAFRHVAAPRPASTEEFQMIEVSDAGRAGPGHAGVEEAATDLSIRHGAGFAGGVVAIMLSEQTLMNAGVLVVAASSGFDLTAGLAGFVFNIFLIVRAPLQLFQAVQNAILPHLSGMEATDSAEEFHRSVRVTVLAITAFAGAVALGLLLIGPLVMRIAVSDHGYTYNRFGLALVGIGMGLHLMSGTFNQAMLARGRAGAAALCWLCAAAAFVAFSALHTIGDIVTRVEVGYCGAAGLLAILLAALYRHTSASSVPAG